MSNSWVPGTLVPGEAPWTPPISVTTQAAQAPDQAPPSNGMTAGTGANADAQAVINQTLQMYGLQSLSSWAWTEITNGASTDQVLVDMYSTPAFAQRFPGIIARQKAGLPPISPADYVTYENQAVQLENQYGLPKGFLTNPERIGTLIGQDKSIQEVGDLVQNGYQQVAFAPPDVRQAFSSMFGANGDAALAAHFLDSPMAEKLLTQQATAATIAGTFAMGGIDVGEPTAMAAAQSGVTESGAQSALGTIQKTPSLFSAQAGEQQTLTGEQGAAAAFGLDPTSQQAIIEREQARTAEFQGGGKALTDSYGTEGAGAARPV